MKDQNIVRMVFPSKSINESLARGAVAVFVSQSDPTIEELNDIKTAVSEAVTNCIVHAYKDTTGQIYMTMRRCDNTVTIEIRDRGCGINDVKAARQPLFTTDSDGGRSGMGFTIMETFMTKIKVFSKKGSGTKVTLCKTLTGR